MKGPGEGCERPRRLVAPEVDDHVVEHRHLAEEAQVLEGPADTGADDVARLQPVEGAPAEAMVPASGLMKPVMTLKTVVLPRRSARRGRSSGCARR